MDKVDILIIHINGEKIIKDCLYSIYKDNKNASVILYLTGTTDNSEEIVRKNFEKVKIFKSDKVLGFAEASNFLVRKSKSKYVVFLNNDTTVEKDFIINMLKTLKKHKNCVAIQPKVKSLMQKDYFEYAGAAGGFIDKYGFPFCRGRIFNLIEKDNNQYDDEVRIFWACGVCMFVDRKFFIETGGFDESLFMYAEELDFCSRSNILGKEIWYSPKAVIYHIGSFSVNNQKINFKKEYLITRNHLIVFIRNHSNLSLIKLLPFRILLELIAAVRFAKKKSLAFILSLFSVPYHFIIEGHTKREQIQRLRKVSDEEISHLVYNKSIALEHFLNGKKTFKELRLG